MQRTTFGIPTIITNCNNYGPYQFPEKLIPLTILKAIRNEPIALYGDGQNIRDWLFVEDHVKALMLLSQNGDVVKIIVEVIAKKLIKRLFL